MNSYRVRHISGCVVSTHRSHDCAMEKFRKCKRGGVFEEPHPASTTDCFEFVVEKFNGTDWIRVW